MRSSIGTSRGSFPHEAVTCSQAMLGLPISSSAISSLALAAGIACSSSLRTVPLGPHLAAGAPTVVEFEPPPAKVEMITEDPGAPCRWLDGRWEWVGRSWRWTSGRWVIPPEQCYFAPPLALWVPSTGTGELFYRPGRWYRDDGQGVCEEEVKPCPGAPTPADRGSHRSRKGPRRRNRDSNGETSATPSSETTGQNPGGPDAVPGSEAPVPR